MTTFKAKSNKNTFDSDLLTHTKMVINLGLYLGNKVYNNVLEDSTWSKDMFLKKLSLALALHDIGKCTLLTQAYYEKPTKNETKFYEAPTHNVLSWAFLKSYLGLINRTDTPVTKGVLHHHVLNQVDLSPINTQNYLWCDYLTEIEREKFIQFYTEIMSYLESEHHITHNISPLTSETASVTVSSESVWQDIMPQQHSNEFDMKHILLDTVTSLIRACVILADRTVSSISETLIHDPNFILNNDIEFFDIYYHNLLNVNTVKGIDLSTRGYDMSRLQNQKNVLKVINEHPHTVISASAGFGKTLIGLMHFLEHRQKITWVVPRNVIASGTYKSILQELKKIDEKDVKVALYCTGDVLESTHANITADNLEECDIIVTNIDSLLNRTVKNNMTRMLLQAYTSTVIFDEFHEFLCQKPLFPAFIRLLWTRVFSTSSKTILLSATPMNLNCFGFTDHIHYLTDTPILNGDMKVNISFKEVNLDNKFNIDEEDSFVITNTIPQALKVYQDLNDEKALLIHAHFTTHDRRNIEKQIYKYHDKFAHLHHDEKNTVVGTNIIGVGLDVSAHNIYDFVLSPENTIQRGCGRGGRFNEPNYNNTIDYIVCTTNRKNKLVSEIFTKDLQNKWLHMLSALDGKTVTKNDLYDLYYEFYKKYRKEVDAMYLKFFQMGNVDLFEITPHKTKKKKNTSVTTICNNMSYRGIGDNIFVTARDIETNEWVEPICVSKNAIKDEEQIHIDENGIDMLKATIFNFISSPHPTFTYEMIANKNKTGVDQYKTQNLYGFGRKGKYTKDNIMKLAFRSDSPLPLFDYKYSKKTGLLSPTQNLDEEYLDE